MIIIMAMNTLQITALTLICVIMAAIMAVAIICIIRATKTRPQPQPVVAKIDEYCPDGEGVATKLSNLIKVKTIASAPQYPETHKETMKKGLDVIKKEFPALTEKCEYRDFDGGILIKWKGATEQKPLVMMSHIDVVPALGTWGHEPFGGDIVDGVVHGRGAVDTKGSLVAMLEAVETMITQGVTPSRDVYIFSSSREEVAGDDAPKAAEYMRSNGIKPYLVIDEGGCILTSPMVGVKGQFAMIAMSESASARILLTVPKASGQVGMNKLAKFAPKVFKMKLSKVKLLPETEQMFRNMTPYMTLPMKCLFSNLWLTKDLLLGVLPMVSPEAKGMIGANVVAQTPNATEIRKYMPGTPLMSATVSTSYYQNLDECVEKFLAECAKAGIYAEVTSKRYTVAPEPLDSPGYREVTKVINAVFPSVVPTPFIQFGGTDARHFMGVADSVIRFAPLDITAQEYKSFHKENEQLRVSKLAKAVEFYRELIARMDIK